MKFVCYKCCDDFQVEPCRLNVPNDPTKTKKDIMAGLTTCPFEGCNYDKGKWIKNGEVYKAEWKQEERR
jgi:hypothetical protein